ncbi:helix-turn-helix domain-containing protein [Rhodocaloribacter litoris]|uniref:helix-turn-helix domain-containing protein n=1 Tax=Rhodocaloribacter litoris TaxID=2558931 RepID=UPI00142231AC|nr:helix-turn-helix domain-containing protein [Rhodocaloribacter litoris]QXD17025.1 helix-turn-helix domain-containing protein [Rhodocaloribacter litoris]
MAQHILTSTEDLREIVAEEVQRALTEALPRAVRAATTKPYLTTEEVREWLGVSERTIRYLTSRRKLPYIKRGNRVLFRTEDVLRYVEEGAVPARRAER